MKRCLILTPTLGESEFLDASVLSVARLKLDVLHVLVTPHDRVEALRERYPQVTVVPDAGREGGIYGALNAGLAAVADESWGWFTYINDDDLLRPEFGAAVDVHVARGVEAVLYGEVDLIGDDGSVLSRITIERSPSWIPALLREGISPLMQQGTLFPRGVVKRLGGFDLRYRLCADLDFWLRAYVSEVEFRHAGCAVACFRLREGQLSGDTAITQREQEMIVDRVLGRDVPWWLRTVARWRYRVTNLPKYVERLRRRGWLTSYQLLEGGMPA